MNYKIILLILFIFLNSCTEKKINYKDEPTINKSFFINKGFTLLYTETLYQNKSISNKIDERELIIFQKNLKKNTQVKITNLINNKSILAKVGVKTDYPNFYNSIISKRIFDELSIDLTEPYVEIIQLVNNSTFIAKKAKTFDQEKNVATKAPVEEIKIMNLSNKEINQPPKKKIAFNYIIKIADFYFKKSSDLMILRIKNETNIKNIKFEKINNQQFRVFLGPFKNLNSLKSEFNAINNLQFDNIEIIKNLYAL